MDALENASTTLQRIRAEYREMPGLKLTVAQASRLWHVDPANAQQLLDLLVADGVLRRTPGGGYLSH